MAKRMPTEVLEYLQGLGKTYGKLGGQTAAANMTAKERPGAGDEGLPGGGQEA